MAIVYEFDEPKDPIFTNDTVRFNGKGNEGHETFYIHKHFSSHYPQFDDSGKAYAFCKTAYKPYDVAVCACLIIFKYWFPNNIDVASDGNIEDWKNGLDVVRDILGDKYIKSFGLGK